MRWVWAIRAMVLAACVIAELEDEGYIHPPFSGASATIALAVLLAIHFAVVVGVTRRRSRRDCSPGAVSPSRSSGDLRK